MSVVQSAIVRKEWRWKLSGRQRLETMGFAAVVLGRAFPAYHVAGDLRYVFAQYLLASILCSLAIAAGWYGAVTGRRQVATVACATIALLLAQDLLSFVTPAVSTTLLVWAHSGAPVDDFAHQLTVVLGAAGPTSAWGIFAIGLAIVAAAPRIARYDVKPTKSR